MLIGAAGLSDYEMSVGPETFSSAVTLQPVGWVRLCKRNMRSVGIISE